VGAYLVEKELGGFYQMDGDGGREMFGFFNVNVQG
jgi:hypothetical protein